MSPAQPAKKPDPLYSLAVVPVKRLGHPEFMVVVLKSVGTTIEKVTPLPDGQWDTLEGALRDLQRAAVQLYRFRNAEALCAGKV